jgi:hypothetical protein
MFFLFAHLAQNMQSRKQLVSYSEKWKIIYSIFLYLFFYELVFNFFTKNIRIFFFLPHCWQCTCVFIQHFLAGSGTGDCAVIFYFA